MPYIGPRYRLIALCAVCALAAPSGAPGGTDFFRASHLENGARIFSQGITAQGRIIQNSHGMEGVGCAMCHGDDGQGGTMHGILAPNITFSALSDPQGFSAPNGRRRPAYNKESVKAAIVAGIDAGGNTLDPEMPRWTGLTAKDLEDVINYLETLGRPRGSFRRPEGI